MDILKLIAQLHSLERKVLPVLSKYNSFNDIVDETKLKDIEVMRALQWLSNKKIIILDEELKEVIDLDKNGFEYLKRKLPERRFLEAIKDNELNLEDMKERAVLSKEELNISLGLLKRKNLISIKKEKKGLIISITDSGRKILGKETLHEQFLKKEFPLEVKSLKDEEKFAYLELKKRKEILKTELVKIKKASLTELGKKIIKQGIKGSFIDTLTHSMLKDSSWKHKQFREYDIKINVPQIYGGKRHFVKDAIDNIRQIMIEFGFKEMTGPLLQTSFWNFDALFTAQDHPVREMQDTFFIKNPKFGKLPKKKIVNRVKQAHEKGVSGSIGWQYSWSEKIAMKNVLRTHTTVLSARTLATLKKTDLPAKFFAVGRCFRNETLDWSHLFEFNQFEGIVIDENVNFRHHIGFMKAFFKKLGFPKARFRPAYFPYTELSMEIDVFHPVHNKWMELGGTGILRPEVVIPLLGKDIPVLAWGPGFDRIIMNYYQITDVRNLYKNDLKQLREVKNWIKK